MLEKIALVLCVLIIACSQSGTKTTSHTIKAQYCNGSDCTSKGYIIKP